MGLEQINPSSRDPGNKKKQVKNYVKLKIKFLTKFNCRTIHRCILKTSTAQQVSGIVFVQQISISSRFTFTKFMFFEIYIYLCF